MNKKGLIGFSLAAVLTGVTALAAAQPPYGGQPGYGMGPGAMGQPYGQGPRGGMMQGQMADPFAVLDLTEEQRNKIQQITAEQRQTHFQNMQKIQQLGQQLAELYNQDTWDASRIGGVYDQIFALQKENILSSVKTRNEIMQVLNEEQRGQLKQRFGAMGPGAGMGPGMGMGRGMGPGMGPGMGRGMGPGMAPGGAGAGY